MVLRKQSLVRSLLELATVTNELSKYKSVNEAALRQDLSLRWTVERGLLAGLNLIFHVADHILASHFQRYPESYEESLSALADCDVISAELHRSLSGAGGFRNILVHEYTRIDIREVTSALQDAPSLFQRFRHEVQAWIDAADDDS